MAHRFRNGQCFVAVLMICYTSLYCVFGDNQTKVIESFHVKSDIRYRFATTQMVSVVRNSAEKAQEIEFDVALPEEAFIVSFSMIIDGKNYDGEVKEKMKAKEEYQTAVSRGQSAGLVQQAPRHTNTFSVSVNVAAGSAVNFTLVYQELLHRKNGLYEHEIHVKPGQAVEDFSIEIYIQDNAKLALVKTPALHTDSLINNTIEAQNDVTVVDRPTPETAHIVYRPNQKQQGNNGISAKFVVQYDVEHSSKGEILVVDGYFIHFFAPDLPPIPKDIIFVLDVSGSMFGTKIEQLKAAMDVILKDLQPQDRFNLIKFSTDVTKWKSELVSVEYGTIQMARKFVQDLVADGMTNINTALLTAINDLHVMKNKGRVGIIFFLTDGQPTTDEQNGKKIAANVEKKNAMKMAIFGLAFGKGADYDLMKTISIQNSGFARKIYEASDAALQVSGLYKEISAVSMKDATISYLPSSVDKFTITENSFPIIFKGSEVVVSGKLARGAKNFEVVIKGIQSSGEVNLIFSDDDYNNLVLKDFENPFFTLPRDFSGIVEKMWAFLTIKQLLKEKERNSTQEKVKEIDNTIIEMSLKYKFVTPLTAMIVKKPDEDKPSVSTLEKGDTVHPEQPNLAYQQRVQHSYMKIAGRHFSIPDSLALAPSGVKFRPSYPVGSDHGGSISGSKGPLGPLNDKTKVQTASFPKKRRNKGKWDKIKINSSGKGIFTDNPLPVFTVVSGNLSLCIVPKKLSIGTYRLITLTNGTFVDLGFVCNKKKCVAPLSDKNASSGKNYATINLVNKEVSGWGYAVSSPFTATESGDVLTISGGGMLIKLMWTVNGESKFYNLEIMLDPKQKYSGLLGDLLNLPAKKMNKLKAAVPSICKNAKLSKTIKNKMAQKYAVKP